MNSESELGVASDGYEPKHKQHWRRLTLAVFACIAGASLLVGSSGKTGLLHTRSAQATLGLAEEEKCGCTSKKNEAQSKCPPNCSPFSGAGACQPFAHGACITKATVDEKLCFVECAKNSAQSVAQAAKDRIDSAKKAAQDGIASVHNVAKDGIDSAHELATDAAKGATDSANSAVETVKDTVGSAAKTAKDTLASVSVEIKLLGKCRAALVPCIRKCGINVPSDAKDVASESGLGTISTDDLTDSAKKCMKKCYDVYEDCVPQDE